MANGTAPVEASSGRVVRHRLNRGGNRQLNKSLHTAAIAQISRKDTEGRAFYERCPQRGKSKREAIRALKRRISDRVLDTPPTRPQTHKADPTLDIEAQLGTAFAGDRTRASGMRALRRSSVLWLQVWARRAPVREMLGFELMG